MSMTCSCVHTCMCFDICDSHRTTFRSQFSSSTIHGFQGHQVYGVSDWYTEPSRPQTKDFWWKNGEYYLTLQQKKNSLGPAHIHVAWVLIGALSLFHLELTKDGVEAIFGFLCDPLLLDDRGLWGDGVNEVGCVCGWVKEIVSGYRPLTCGGVQFGRQDWCPLSHAVPHYHFRGWGLSCG